MLYVANEQSYFENMMSYTTHESLTKRKRKCIDFFSDKHYDYTSVVSADFETCHYSFNTKKFKQFSVFIFLTERKCT